MLIFLFKSWTKVVKCTVVRTMRSSCMLFQKNKKKPHKRTWLNVVIKISDIHTSKN